MCVCVCVCFLYGLLGPELFYFEPEDQLLNPFHMIGSGFWNVNYYVCNSARATLGLNEKSPNVQ